MAVDAGVAEALVDLGEAGGAVVTFWTHAGEAVDAIDAGAAVVAGVDGALVDVDVTHGACRGGAVSLTVSEQQMYRQETDHNICQQEDFFDLFEAFFKKKEGKIHNTN